MEVPSGKEVVRLLSWASNLGITDVITYKVDPSILKLFTQYKLNLYVGIQIDSPNEIIQDYINGTLKSDKKLFQK